MAAPGEARAKPGRARVCASLGRPRYRGGQAPGAEKPGWGWEGAVGQWVAGLLLGPQGRGSGSALPRAKLSLLRPWGPLRTLPPPPPAVGAGGTRPSGQTGPLRSPFPASPGWSPLPDLHRGLEKRRSGGGPRPERNERRGQAPRVLPVSGAASARKAGPEAAALRGPWGRSRAFCSGVP